MVVAWSWANAGAVRPCIHETRGRTDLLEEAAVRTAGVGLEHPQLAPGGGFALGAAGGLAGDGAVIPEIAVRMIDAGRCRAAGRPGFWRSGGPRIHQGEEQEEQGRGHGGALGPDPCGKGLCRAPARMCRPPTAKL